MTSRFLLGSALGLTAFVTLACDSNEPTTDDDHTPVRVVMSVGTDTMPDDTLRIPAGQTVTVHCTFFNSMDDNLDDVESEHYSLLTFDPAGLGTATPDAAHHFTHSVVVQGTAGDTGHVAIGFGHDALADEHSLSRPVQIQ